MTRAWMDRIGTVASAACALHCAALSLAPALLPFLGLGFLRDERFEWMFLIGAVAFAVGAAWLGHRAHRAWSITVGFALGVLALVGARLAEVGGLEGGLWLALLGGALLVGMHVANLRRCRSCVTDVCA